MEITVEALTGQRRRVAVQPGDTVLQLKRRLSELFGVAVHSQSLIWRDKALQPVERRLADCGLVDGAVVSLVLLPRAGPATLTVDASLPSTSAVAAASPDEQHEPPLLDWSFTPTRRADAYRRADENLRTMDKMRVIRQNLERMRVQRNRPSVTAATQTPQEAVEPSVRAQAASARRSFPRSAPEDTSAKESSAGETELEEPSAFGVPALPNRRDANAAESSAVTDCDAKPRAVPQTRHSHAPPRHTRPTWSHLRVASSSSEPESSGPVWTTGSERDDEALVTADERSAVARVHLPMGTDDDDDVYFSGDSGLPLLEAATAPRPPPPRDTTSDPSELSSGVLVAAELRRMKVRRKHHLQPRRPESVGAVRAPSAPPPRDALAVRAKPLRPLPPACKNRPRSKQRFVGQCAGVVTKAVAAPVEASSTADSSSDEKTKRQVQSFAPSTSQPLLVAPSRKQLLAVRSMKHRAERMQNADAPVRMHKQPQSSQSQQRCATCGCRLSFELTFQCRCGRTLCSKHRNREAHACSYELGKHAEAAIRQMTEVSDRSD